MPHEKPSSFTTTHPFSEPELANPINYPDAAAQMSIKYWVHGTGDLKASGEMVINRDPDLDCSLARVCENLFIQQPSQSTLKYFKHFLTDEVLKVLTSHDLQMVNLWAIKYHLRSHVTRGIDVNFRVLSVLLASDNSRLFFDDFSVN